MIRQAIIKTLQPTYDGKTFGLQFNGGLAVMTDPGLNAKGEPLPVGRPDWGWTFDRILTEFKSMPGYEVTVVEPDKPAPAKK